MMRESNEKAQRSNLYLRIANDLQLHLEDRTSEEGQPTLKDIAKHYMDNSKYDVAAMKAFAKLWDRSGDISMTNYWCRPSVRMAGPNDDGSTPPYFFRNDNKKDDGDMDQQNDQHPDLTPNDIFVPKYYEMDPETDDVIPTGDGLRVGMMVLIENCMKRVDLDAWDVRDVGPGVIHELRKWNRWGKVATYPGVTEEKEVYFILEYDDGTKMQIKTNKFFAWFVKKDSIPKEQEIESGYLTFVNDQGEIDIDLKDATDAALTSVSKTLKSFEAKPYDYIDMPAQQAGRIATRLAVQTAAPLIVKQVRAKIAEETPKMPVLSSADEKKIFEGS